MKVESRETTPGGLWRNRQLHRLRWGLLLVLCLGGLGMLVVSTAGATPETALWPWPWLILWTAMLGLAASATLPLPGLRRSVGLGGFFEFAALLLYGTAPACWLVVGARGIRFGLRRLRPLRPLTSTSKPSHRFHMGSLLLHRDLLETIGSVLALGVAGLVLQRSGILPTAVQSGTMGTGLLLAATLFLVPRFLMIWLLEVRHARALPTASPGTIGIHLVWEAFLLLCALFLVTLHVVIGPLAFFSCVLPLAVMLYAHRLWREARSGHVEAVRALTAAIDAADPMTRGLSERISKMSVQVARQLGLGREAVQEIEYAALLHEVGRTAIQRDVRFKPGGLSQQEKTELRMHPRLGSQVVQRFGFFAGAPSIVLSHHEQPDGKGYPRGLQGEEIPLGSRILMAVAAFDAMTSDRPYRRGLPPKTAFDELLSLAGHQFFPDVVEALIDLYASGELFSAFEADVLERFARGEGNSRALEEHLVQRGHRLARPDPAHESGEPEDDGVPILELPAAEPGQATPKSAQERTHVVHEQFDLGRGAALRLDVAAVSDVGCVRENNEDAFGLFRELPRRHGAVSEDTDAGCLVVVADGMGGAAGGEVASNLAVDMVRDSYFGNDVHDSCRDSLHESLRLANELIHWRSASESALQGMGTTCTAAALVGNELHVAHVGDSRAYLVRSGSVERLTRDHTLAAELRAATGQDGPPGAHSILTRCLGSRTEVEVELSRSVRLQAGDILVLCSDGLWNQVDAQEIREVVLAQSPEVACSQLVERARQRGGPDNITVVVARVETA